MKQLRNIKLIQKNQCLQNYRMSQKENQFLVSASPKVRKFARELGVDISKVLGSERDGRIIEDDIKIFVSNKTNQNLKLEIKENDKEELEYPHVNESINRRILSMDCIQYRNI